MRFVRLVRFPGKDLGEVASASAVRSPLPHGPPIPQTIRNNAAMQADGFRVQAANVGAQSNLYSASAANMMDALPNAGPRRSVEKR